MTYQEFFKKYNNTFADFDGVYGRQCFDLFQFYNRDVVGGKFVPGEGAADIWVTYPKDLYEKIPNTPTGIPMRGDVVIWDRSYGQFGHVGIATGVGDTKKFECLEQNDPVGSNSHVRSYNYNHVFGWLRPKKQTDPCEERMKEALGKQENYIKGLENSNKTMGIDIEKQNKFMDKVWGILDPTAKDKNAKLFLEKLQSLRDKVNEVQKIVQPKLDNEQQEIDGPSNLLSRVINNLIIGLKKGKK